MRLAYSTQLLTLHHIWKELEPFGATERLQEQ